jgi:hypothetical protein
MKMLDVRRKAKELGVKAQGMTKANLIRAIQTAECNTPCFATGRTECDQILCCWQEDCLPVKMEEHK